MKGIRVLALPWRLFGALSLLAVIGIGCSGGGGGSEENVAGRDTGSSSADFDCDGSCANQQLSSGDVSRILTQAVAQANLLGVSGTFAVTDRVGNVLAVYQMPGANGSTTIQGGGVGGLEGATVPAVLAAISKAGTGAYLSSQGNAFTTRTASQIVQQNFNPGEGFQAGGPLFGVQFSQLICSDVTIKSPEFAAGLSVGSRQPLAGGLVGPRPLPLGLSADPGGLPLYKLGDVVGGIGVELDGIYTADTNIADNDDDIEERIALAATVGGFEAPADRTGDRIFVLGKSLRYTDLSYSDLDIPQEPLPDLDPSGLVAVPGFTNATIRAGAIFGTAESGFLRTSRAGVTTMTLVDGNGNVRFPSRSGSSLGGTELSATEVEAILDSTVNTAFRARAGIRRPLDDAVRVSAWVIDHLGNPLGFARSDDAPVFGTDVSLQKGRAAAFFSSPDAADLLIGAGLGSYVERTREFIGPAAFTGTHAFADRSIGNLARPFFPDGVNGNGPGPLSLPFPGLGSGPFFWSPFNTGLQLDLIIGGIVAPLSGSLPDDCAPAFGRRINNGIQIFPGSVPLYRGTQLIGALGISGDGIDQDDLVAFFSASRQGLDFVGHLTIGDPVLGFNAPKEIRADTIPLSVENTRLRYVNCPESPFRGDSDQNVCEGL